MTEQQSTIWVLSLATAFAFAAALSLAVATAARAATAEDLNRDSFQALRHLTQSNSAAAAVARSARAVLVFPNIIKAGLVFGGAYGEGTLIEGNRVVDYYNSVSGSWGLQAGAQSYGYAVFLMNDDAVDYIERTAGFEIGVGPTVVLVDEGVAKNLSTTTLKDDAYAFIFNQQGLMAGISLEGTKISRIDRGGPSQASR
jgi:lipid-binding SYLF domain-containing protein